MDVRIEIEGETATCKQGGIARFSAPVADFVSALTARRDDAPFLDAIPEGTRFIRSHGDSVVLVLEKKPTMRTVRWLADDSPAPYGPKARYKKARLAFPFVVLVVVFRGGALTGQSQCFYRVSPLAATSDELLLPNLYNVAKAYDQDCWVCLLNMEESLAPLSWSGKVDAIWNHIFGASFNKSSEEHEGMSYWSVMRSLDPRVASLRAWKKASAKDPYFALDIPWKPVGKSIETVMEEMLETRRMEAFPPDATSLAQVLNGVRKRKAKR